jgi:hypothetical protein
MENLQMVALLQEFRSLGLNIWQWAGSIGDEMECAILLVLTVAGANRGFRALKEDCRACAVRYLFLYPILT